ncbi:hypothetical protein [Kiloniella laminariae]|uniref:hypothetical protein n=1 Tax=Kiloniella laminariae TaxID=454162 RepID=UPI0003809C1C|nr:hypothetical protein [Kiloniella laminariae]
MPKNVKIKGISNSETKTKYLLRAYAGDKGSEEIIYNITSEEPLFTFHVGEIINTDFGITPGFPKLTTGPLFQIISIEKGIEQDPSGSYITCTTDIFTKIKNDKSSGSYKVQKLRV